MNARRTVLVAGATGKTGRRVVIQLLAWGHAVRAMVRDPDRLPSGLAGHAGLELIEGSPLTVDDPTLVEAVRGCDAIVSCLGHNVTLRGLFGPPYRLVTRSVERLCATARACQPRETVRFVLMGSAGVRQPGVDAQVSRAERLVLALLRALVPPHADNECAADFLRSSVGEGDRAIDWTVVRPDSLEEGIGVSGYAVYPSPLRSAIFEAGRARRANVAHFMARLACDEATWRQWRHRMPVLYNQADPVNARR